jgi:hypothetical protein
LEQRRRRRYNAIDPKILAENGQQWRNCYYTHSFPPTPAKMKSTNTSSKTTHLHPKSTQPVS